MSFSGRVKRGARGDRGLLEVLERYQHMVVSKRLLAKCLGTKACDISTSEAVKCLGMRLQPQGSHLRGEKKQRCQGKTREPTGNANMRGESRYLC